jgi:hypothetical protein
MKIILSRKGFDSSNGESASPILPSGQLRSLPIPDDEGNVRYSQIYAGSDYPTGEIVAALTGGKTTADSLAHCDPDVDRDALPNRHPDWRGVFGQSGNAQGELGKVEVGDLFLFFGWFRETVGTVKDLQFKKDALNKHVVWGYLQIDEIVPVNSKTTKSYPQYETHPHVAFPDRNEGNTIYIAKKGLDISGLKLSLPGYGIFPTFDTRLRLTVNGESRRSHWSLPQWFKDYKISGGVEKDEHWKPLDNGNLLFISRPQGQEFICDLGDDTAVAAQWLRSIFNCAK